jgi:hypothetical protein
MKTMPNYVIDIEKRMTNIMTFAVSAETYEEAHEKAMERAVAFNWPEPDHEEMAILYTHEERGRQNGQSEGSVDEDSNSQTD